MWRLFLIFTLAFASACGGGSITLADVSAPQAWGAADNVTSVRSLYFSEQPDAESLQVARSNGVTTVINLREPGEIDWDEQAAARAQGLEYFNVPIARQSDTLDANALAQINAIIDARAGQPVLIHCASGNRAAAWFATHLVEAHAMPQSEALTIAEQVGLTNATMKERVETYFDAAR